MAYIYALSDIHGYLDTMEEVLSLVDLKSDKDNKLIFCGDYMDYGLDSCKTLYRIMKWMQDYPNQVFVLMGNHEHMFLNFLNSEDDDIWNVEWLGTDKNFSTVNLFISKSCKEKINLIKVEQDLHHYLFQIAKIIKDDILINHKKLINWLKDLPFYYETERQIFVHAGIDEEAEEYWMYGSSKETFVNKFPATFGRFYRDIISGHISTSSLKKDSSFHDVFWDGKSHFYIDGETNISNNIPLLKYNSINKQYSSFKKHMVENKDILWEEYIISINS